MYFTVNDDFERIIKDNLNAKKLEISKILTGWTNYVYCAKVSKRKSYIFRFPRNNFFAETLIKEESFCRYISRKISYKVPNIKLFYDNGRPYTSHRYMNGKSLTECHDVLNEKEKKQLAFDISKFIFEMQNLSQEPLTLPKLSDFLEGLSKVGDEGYDIEKHTLLKELENKKLVLCHGDFNPGNVLLNKRNKMFAVLDFAFLSFSSDIVDLSRIIGRLPKEYYQIMLEEYEKRFNCKISRALVDSIIDIWTYVEEKYIAYMLKYQPDVVLPK